MCGLFGAIGNIDMQILSIVAAEAGRRGPQASGIAWVEDGKLKTRKELGKIHPDKFLKDIHTNIAIGNCRLGTSGSFLDMNNNQPIVIGDTAISHNGNILNSSEIAKEMNVELQTLCDSEIIVHMIKRYGMKDTISKLSQSVPFALIVLQSNKISAYRKGQPLYYLNKAGCHYLCSRVFYGAKQIPEDTIMDFGLEGGDQ